MSGAVDNDGYGAANNRHSEDVSEIPDSPVAGPSQIHEPNPDPPATNARSEAVEAILSSEIGINTLLVRLKQSIASAREFATFLKKRSQLEEEQASGLKRLTRSNLESLRRSEVRAGSYASQVSDIMHCHERIADNGMQFALSLHQMHEDLAELSANMERGRKQWKHEGLDAEKRASDAEAAMQKAKARYDSLAEDYDRARTGDTKGSRRIGLKGPKSAEQYESDLLRKVQAADTDYEEKVRTAQGQRDSLLREGRPRAVKALRELCQECDSGLALQLQKFATFNEKLLLGNGLAISPLADEKTVGGPKGLRDTVALIDNDTDLNDYVTSHRLPPKPSEIRYERHPTLLPKTQIPTPQKPSFGAPSNTYSPQTPAQPHGARNASYSSQNIPGLVTAGNQSSPYGSNVAHNSPYQQPPQSSPYGQTAAPPYQAPSNARPEHDAFMSPPYPVHPTDRQQYSSPAGAPPQSSANNASPAIAAPAFSTPSPLMAHPPHFDAPLPSTTRGSSRPVFGVSLDDLFARDQSAVPAVVAHCILAVDTFGLDTEGIYRVSGTTSQVNALRDRFNTNVNSVDFQNPQNFGHDINSVAQLLKQFFRELPDPLFTHAAYNDFIQAARADDDIARRDGLHQLINDLPDPNYATLRALVLHLHRVMLHENRNRMGSSNLALCFAPSIMGQHTGAQIADASFQARVVDTILQNATAIFDDD